MKRNVIGMSLAGISALMGGMLGSTTTNPKIPTYHGGRTKIKRTKGKRDRSLKERSNRRN